MALWLTNTALFVTALVAMPIVAMPIVAGSIALVDCLPLAVVGVRLLRSDSSVVCAEGGHNAMSAVAVAMLLLVGVGLPLALVPVVVLQGFAAISSITRYCAGEKAGAFWVACPNARDRSEHLCLPQQQFYHLANLTMLAEGWGGGKRLFCCAIQLSRWPCSCFLSQVDSPQQQMAACTGLCPPAA
jgi:hypothetical protein